MATTINADNVTGGAVVTGDSSGVLGLQTAGTTRMTIDGSGNVGIGASPSATRGNLQVIQSGISGGNPASSGSTDANQFAAIGNTNVSLRLGFYASGGCWIQNSAISNYATNYDLVLQPNGGNVGVGTTSPAEELHVVGQGYFSAGCYIGVRTSTNTLIDDASNGSGTTTLYIGNAAITTSSDARLKENVTDTEVDALAKVQALRVVDFTWNDPSDTSWNNKNARGKWTGLIAQEAIAHVPWAVNAPRDQETMEPLPDAKDEQGNDQHWFMEHGQLVPLLVKAIQEQQQQIDALKAEVASLKGN